MVGRTHRGQTLEQLEEALRRRRDAAGQVDSLLRALSGFVEEVELRMDRFASLAQVLPILLHKFPK